MKKGIKNKRLGRDTHARKALFKGQIVSLITSESITTTTAKARALRGIFEKLLTKARVGSLHARRQVQSFIQDPDATKKLVDDIAPRFKGVKGGYTRLTMVGNRRGDNASMVRLSLGKTAAKDEAPAPKKSKKSSSSKKDSSKKEKTKKSTTPKVAVADTKKVQSPKTASAPQSGSRIGVRQGDR